jgi:hypothetical protein
MVNYSDVIIALHDLARKQWDTDPETSQRLRFLADEVARLGNEAHERELAKNKVQYQD